VGSCGGGTKFRHGREMDAFWKLISPEEVKWQSIDSFVKFKEVLLPLIQRVVEIY
jgi:hypothetical protein